jgi:hypothetical protein
MLINFWIDAPGTNPGGAPPPPHKIGKNIIFWRKIVIFHTKYPKNVRASLCSAQFFFKSASLTWNPGSAPDINLNMYIINVIADDESKIGLYEI